MTESTYIENLDKHISKGNKPKRWLWVIFGFYFLSLLLLIALIVLLHISVELNKEFKEFTTYKILQISLVGTYIGFFFYLMMGLFVWTRYKDVASSGEQFIQRYSQLLKHSRDEGIIGKVIHETCTSMNIDEDIYVLLLPQLSIFPSVESYDRKNVLVIPLGFVNYLKKSPNEARFMLAHEIAHIRQKDLYLFRASEAYGKVLVPLILILQSLSIVLKYITLVGVNSPVSSRYEEYILFLFIPEILTMVSVLAASSIVKSIRDNSERLADWGASLVTSSEAGIKLFERIKSMCGEVDYNHPKPQDRIDHINKVHSE